jgi:uncharacterized phiE125 gp8 family phage protein
MRYNDIIEVQVTTDVANFAAEPLTLDMVKRHLNLLFDTTGSAVFDDDDTYLTELVSQCRESMEQYLGLSMAVKSYRAILRNECGGLEIPFGPVTAIASVKDIDAVLLVDGDTYQLRGNQFKWLESPVSCYTDIVYTSGYTPANIPQGLKRALLEEIAFRYNNRGDQTNKFAGENVGLSQGAMELCSRYSRKSLVS